MVNRLWQHHFGEGIVRTPSNFGKMGEQPSHPELLDWLASQFVARGWSMKAMHRLMMNSQLYQMSSNDNMADVGIDPENRYFWRMPRERLEAEVLRGCRMRRSAGTLDVVPWAGPRSTCISRRMSSRGSSIRISPASRMTILPHGGAASMSFPKQQHPVSAV